MSTSNELSDTETSRLRMKPALSRIFCCSVTAASGFIAAYALVAYAIALIYEIVWVVESQSGLPLASVLLMVCYCVVITATVILVHGLIANLIREGLVLLEGVREPRLAAVVAEYRQAQEHAKSSRLNLWRHGDITDDDAVEFGARR